MFSKTFEHDTFANVPGPAKGAQIPNLLAANHQNSIGPKTFTFSPEISP